MDPKGSMLNDEYVGKITKNKNVISNISANYVSLLSGWQDSNLRPPAPKAGALTGLRYTPMKAWVWVWV
jgi:hypothetical protein